MSQLFQILISISLGFLYGLIFKYISKSKFLTCIITISLTIGYIYLMYNLNLGIINYILKISIIVGFILSTKVSTNKKRV